MTDVEVNFYEVLGVSETASSEEIHKAYKMIIRKHHPDVSPTEESADISRLANAAKTVLLNEEKRAEYDEGLHGAQNPPEDEDWIPSWGEDTEDSGWGEEFEAEVVDDPADDAWDDYSDDESWDDHSDDSFEPPRANYDFSEETPPEIPPVLRDAPTVFVSKKWDAFLVLPLILVMTGLAILVSPVEEPFESLVQLLALVTGLAVFFSVSRWDFKAESLFKWTFKWNIQLAASAAGFAALYFGMGNFLTPSQARMGFPIAVSVVTALITSSTFWSYNLHRKSVKPKSLKKNNSFGGVTGTVEEVVVEDALKSLWGVPGMRVFRVWRPSFTHVVIFGNKIVLIKGVVMVDPGRIEWFSNSLHNKYRVGRKSFFAKLLGNEYSVDLARMINSLPKKAEVFPIVAAFPMGYVQGVSDNDQATVVAGEDLAALVAKILFNGQTENIVDHELISKAFMAA